MRNAGMPDPSGPAAVTQEVAERAVRALTTCSSDVVRREHTMFDEAKQFADRSVSDDRKGKAAVDGTQQTPGPGDTAGSRDRAATPDTAQDRGSSDGATHTASGDGTGEPPRPPRGAGSGADDGDSSGRLDMTVPANAVSGARTRDALSTMLRDWSSPGHIDDIANAVGYTVQHGRGTARITANTVDLPDGSRTLDIEVTHTNGTSQVHTTWDLDRTPRSVERGPHSDPPPKKKTGVDGDDRGLWGQDGRAVDQEYQKDVRPIRNSVAEQLSAEYPWLTEDQIYDAKVVTSELYTNAVSYSPDHRANIEITAPREGQVRISIENVLAPGGAEKMAPWIPDQQPPEREGGRGTQLAHELSAACGRELRFGTEGSTATQWFELHEGVESNPVVDAGEFADVVAELGR
ncbi:ATP-binding protein [Nocardia sp. NPDC003963]